MKPVYESLPIKEGLHNGGICAIEIIPTEWLPANPVMDFNTGKIISVINPTNPWLLLSFIPRSYEYTETPKQSSSGTYYEITATGVLNNIDAAMRQRLETLQYHQHIIQLKDRAGNIKLIGTKDRGADVQITYNYSNTSGGMQTATFSLYFESEQSPPYYEPA